jgi:hypothetical protein
MKGSWTWETLTLFIDQVDETTKRKPHGQTYETTRSIVCTFSAFASHLGDITKSMTLNSELGIVLGSIAVLTSVSLILAACKIYTLMILSLAVIF